MKSITQNLTETLKLTLDEIQEHHGKDYCCVTVEMTRSADGTESFVTRAYENNWEIGWTKEFSKVEELNAYIGSQAFKDDCHQKRMEKLNAQIAKLEKERDELIKTYVTS